MPDVAERAVATRVVLLARPGAASDRLGDALKEAGADLVLVADPTSADQASIEAATPQAIIVALEPSVEDALERFDRVLSDPGISVIFDEAELAAQRAGWDAARWVRHLSAKLHRHADVLPPGTEEEADWHPSPGPLQNTVRPVSELDFSAFADEAVQRAGELPRDAVLEALRVPAPAAETASGSAFDPVAFETDVFAPQDGADDARATAFDEPEFDESVSADASGSDATEADADAIAFDGIELEAIDSDADADNLAPSASATGRDATVAPAPVEFSDGGLSLADTDSYGHGPRRGAVLVEAGLGGPDAVRQLLGELPTGFPRPILVRLRLDGGRYDRLVKQMERATPLPVLLAEPGHVLERGHVYFLPPEVTVAEAQGRLSFELGGDAPFVALPAGDSAVLFLSGSDRAVVEQAMHASWGEGALVAAQSPESCYDGAAATDVIARGGASGSPAELAERLTARWPY